MQNHDDGDDYDWWWWTMMMGDDDCSQNRIFKLSVCNRLHYQDTNLRLMCWSICFCATNYTRVEWSTRGCSGIQVHWQLQECHPAPPVGSISILLIRTLCPNRQRCTGSGILPIILTDTEQISLLKQAVEPTCDLSCGFSSRLLINQHCQFVIHLCL